jgi:hypothetical protein
MNIFLPQLYKNITGTNMKWRTNQLRQGGNYVFNETNKQGELLSTNGFLQNSSPYLTIFSSQYNVHPYENDSETFLVHYFYPDPLHLSDSIRSTLPAELQSRLKSSYGPNEQSVFEKDTSDIIESLLLNVFSKYYNQDATEETIARFIFDLISINPFSDFNERVVNFYGIAASLDANRLLSIPFLSDFNIRTESGIYSQQLLDSTIAAQKLKSSMIFEAMNAIIDNRTPQYSLLPEWNNFIVQSLNQFQGFIPHTFGIKFSHTENQLIEQKKFIELFDSWFGFEWHTRNI